MPTPPPPLQRGPLNDMTSTVATNRLLCVLPCVCTAFCVYRLACGPLNNMTPAMAIDRLLCVPPCVCTAFSVYCLVYGPLNNMTPAVKHPPLAISHPPPSRETVTYIFF